MELIDIYFFTQVIAENMNRTGCLEKPGELHIIAIDELSWVTKTVNVAVQY